MRAWKALRSAATVTGHEVSVRRDGARTMCLEGTTPQDRLLLESRTERNDSNQVRSARVIQLIRYGLENSRLVAMYKEPVLRA